MHLPILRNSPTVKRVVITSSVAAITEPNKEPKPYNFTEKDWNEYSIDIVEKQGRAAPVFHWYRASKSLAEQAAWNFVKGAPNVQFDLVTINPPFVSCCVDSLAHHEECSAILIVHPCFLRL